MKRTHGFTLIELAIVLVIMTILIGGLAMPLSAQIQARRIAETNRTLEEAREAIIGYAMSHRSTAACTCTYSPGNPVTATPLACLSFCPVSTVTDTVTGDITLPTGHRLPCPDKLDDGDPLTTDDGDGVADHIGADPTADCVKPYGYLPWATLGVASQDAWGNRLRYAVSDAFSKSAGFSNTDPGDLNVCDSSANAGTSDCTTGNVANEVPVVVLSHGPNGWGALNVNGNTLAPLGGDGEKENANIDTEFVSSHPYKPADDSATEQAKEFDDLVRWISADQIRGRVCPSGGCP
ncbi:MAG: type II secretion system protein [Thiobacillus sp.]|nr:type II secretion system protein [Thiobacillus sp.]